MRYDFDEIISRQDTDSIKWTGRPEVNYKIPPLNEILPMWIADMDFKSSPKIIEAMTEIAQFGNYGYSKIPDSAYNAVINWMKTRHNWEIDRDWVIFMPGAVAAGHLGVQAMTQPGDHVILQPPVYYPFYRTVLNNGCHLDLNPLKISGLKYKLDLENFKELAKNPRTSMFILCSPHNPAGRVWTREELRELGEICLNEDVFILSDELHSDLIMPGFKHVPFASISEDFANNSITVIAPSKTFNLPGLQATVLIIPNPKIKLKFQNVMARNSTPELNIFAVKALEVAYNNCADWLEEVILYIHENYKFLASELNKNLPDVKIFPMEGTYLSWMDFSKYESDFKILEKRMLCDAKLWLDEGYIFGEQGKLFERMTLACPRAYIIEAVKRLSQTFKK